MIPLQKTAIIVVTYNRLKNLQATLTACLQQEGDFQIFVVDNASTDNTRQYLVELAAADARITVCPLPENTGGAGGFSHGMQKAHAKGFTWLWLMDDDVEPLPGALAILLSHGHHARCIYPAKECANGRIFAFEGRINRTTLKRSYVHQLPELATQGWVSVNSGNFEGAFIHKDVVDAIGLPETHFFICWDDALYGIKAAEHFPCIYINDVCMRKQFDKEKLHIGGNALLSSTPFSRYYFFRNYWYVMRYLRDSNGLSPVAYLLYAMQLGKALALTLLFDRSMTGSIKLLQGAWQGYSHFKNYRR